MKTLLALMMIVAFSAQAATQVMLAWEQPDDTNWIIGGYEVRIFTNSPALEASNQVYTLTSTVTNVLWDIPQVGVRYWATVLAKDTNGIASEQSNPVMFWKPSKPVLKISPKLQLSASVDGPWFDSINLDPMTVEMAGDAAFWRMKMGIELVDVEIN